MSTKPIFIATHPRACSTAFERVFMTRTDILSCVHEPFGDAYYYGPERMAQRYENDIHAREASGFSSSTFNTIFQRFEEEAKEGKRLFIKDIAHYLVPPEGQVASIAPSLGGRRVKKGVGTDGFGSKQTNGDLNGAINGDIQIPNGHYKANGHAKNGTNGHANGHTNGINGHTNGHTNGHPSGTKKTPYPYNTESEPGNPTVIPKALLQKFHFAFLIRHPRSSIPSYYHCTIPPQSHITGFHQFMPSEAGYSELRRVFDFLKSEGQIGPLVSGQPGFEQVNGGAQGKVNITVVDADDLLHNPEGIIRVFCKAVGIDFKPEMLKWGDEGSQERAREAFEKWPGFHTSAIESTELRGRTHKKQPKSCEQENAEWKDKYGEEGARLIRECVDANLEDYEYLRGFALKAADE